MDEGARKVVRKEEIYLEADCLRYYFLRSQRTYCILRTGLMKRYRRLSAVQRLRYASAVFWGAEPLSLNCISPYAIIVFRTRLTIHNYLYPCKVLFNPTRSSPFAFFRSIPRLLPVLFSLHNNPSRTKSSLHITSPDSSQTRQNIGNPIFDFSFFPITNSFSGICG